jgi:opacity protein-like surface antigen
MSRRIVLTLALTALASGTASASAQVARSTPRIRLSGWVGLFANENAGFASGTNDFFSFNRSVAFGGGIHTEVRRGLAVGIDGAYSAPGYTHFQRNPAQNLNTGDATVYSAILSARLQASPGQFGLYLTGGAGVFFFDVPELGEANRDNALNAGVGVEYLLNQRLSLFGEYNQWWIYHDKVDDVLKNKVNRTLFKIGTRVGVL